MMEKACPQQSQQKRYKRYKGNTFHFSTRHHRNAVHCALSFSRVRCTVSQQPQQRSSRAYTYTPPFGQPNTGSRNRRYCMCRPLAGNTHNYRPSLDTQQLHLQCGWEDLFLIAAQSGPKITLILNPNAKTKTIKSIKQL